VTRLDWHLAFMWFESRPGIQRFWPPFIPARQMR